MRPRADEGLNERWIAGLARQRLPECDTVKRYAKARLVEAVRGRLTPIEGNGIWVHKAFATSTSTHNTIFPNELILIGNDFRAKGFKAYGCSLP